jgi:hypothetical protein
MRFRDVCVALSLLFLDAKKTSFPRYAFKCFKLDRTFLDNIDIDGESLRTIEKELINYATTLQIQINGITI